MKNLLINLRSVLLWISGLSTFLAGSVFILLTSLFAGEKKLTKTIRLLSKSTLFMIGSRIRITGLENYHPDKHYVIMMNHINFLDQFMFFKVFPGEAKGIEEESHFSWPVYGQLLKRTRQIPINRKNPRRARESLKKAVEILKSNNFSICILPEGTRTRTGDLGSFKKGGFLMAVESGLDILPILQKGSYEIKRKGHWLLKPGRVDCIIEKPISVQGYTRKNLADLMNKTRTVFLKHLK
jgi:1-acyl-sn-glycerol-3-phosphate acyltransferase